MKTFGITLVFAVWAGFDLAAASPAVRRLSVSQGRSTVGGQRVTHNMTWVGRIFPGDTHHTTIVGDLKTIYDRILSLNPNFEKDFAKEHPSSGGTHGTIPRKAADNPDNSTIQCTGDHSPTTWPWCHDALLYLTTMGSGAGTCTVNANECSNVYCNEDCQVRVCNYEATPFNARCSDLATDMSKIYEACPVYSEVWPGGRDWFGGVRIWPGQHETQVSRCDIWS